MMWIRERLQSFGDRACLVSKDSSLSYAELCQKVSIWRLQLSGLGILPGDVVSLIGDYSTDVAALMLALLGNGNIVVPFTADSQPGHDRFMKLTGAAFVFRFQPGYTIWTVECRSPNSPPELISGLQKKRQAGLVLFTSGTSGESKGVVLQASKLLQRFREAPIRSHRAMTSLVFLKLDHIGGVNTLFSVLMNGGTGVTLRDRSPAAVCQAIEQHRGELLPTTPTFLNMLLLSGLHRQYDLSSLKLITYGTEPMPDSTLRATVEAFPGVKIKQTYGLTEFGILPTKSKNSRSAWLKIGDGVETRIVDGILHLRSDTAMLGYLNAPSPFTQDGWYNTGDRVEVVDGYLRILGRNSEIINVGGEKVFPAEVESVLLELSNVKDVVVEGKPSPVTGQIVTAQVLLHDREERTTLQRRISEHCHGRLEAFKVPRLVRISDQALIGHRLKKVRASYDQPTEAVS